MEPCKFFRQGSCRNGQFCSFSHGVNVTLPCSSGNDSVNSRNLVPGIHQVNPSLEAQRTPICRYFQQGSCRRGQQCYYLHPANDTQIHVSLFANATANKILPMDDESPFPGYKDSRANAPCKFLGSVTGCTKSACPYNHDDVKQTVDSFENLNLLPSDEEGEPDNESHRDILGAHVDFDDSGKIAKVSLPMDFSAARITGFGADTTREEIIEILQGLGSTVATNQIRAYADTGLQGVSAIVKAEDPNFARHICNTLEAEQCAISATIIPASMEQFKCRKVYLSWHRATRSVWLNFENGKVAARVANRFNQGGYTCLGQSIKSSPPKSSPDQHFHRARHNSLPWTIVLSNIPAEATADDVKKSIKDTRDKPGHVEMGTASYNVSYENTGASIRSLLEGYGPLESFYLSPTVKSARVRASAWFRDETDAHSAAVLDNKALDILNNGKLSLALVHSITMKIDTVAYLACKTLINDRITAWRACYVTLKVYPHPVQRFTVVKIEGTVVKDVASAKRDLTGILRGIALQDECDTIWSPSFGGNGPTYQKLKHIQTKLGVLIRRDRIKRELRYLGPVKHFAETVKQVKNLTKNEGTTGVEINLDQERFSWAIRGGFSKIEQVLGKGVAVFNVVTRRVTITGTQHHYQLAKDIVDGKHSGGLPAVPDGLPTDHHNCPICFCEAESPVQLSCQHTYCLQCFEDCCKSAASGGRDGLSVKCQGDGGRCTTFFSLREIKEHLQSNAIEAVLTSSFEEYIKCRPESLRFCPTPDCGFVYRCLLPSDGRALVHTCQNCLEPICVNCHASHVGLSCAEHKDIASGGYEALKQLKKELNIKDCPQCTTPIEKTHGCNHMTCIGCKAHICWFCMAVFKTGELCYRHMEKHHSGIYG